MGGWYCQQTGVSYFLTYDNAVSAAYKASWVKKQNLGGVMFWSLSGDTPIADPNSLVMAAINVLK